MPPFFKANREQISTGHRRETPSEQIYGGAMEFCFRDRSLVSNRITLDLGTGPGDIAAVMSLLGAHVIALDSSMQSLIGARELLNQHACDRPSYVVAAAESLPFRTSGIEVAFSRSTFQYMDLSRAVAELQRVIRPGGTVLLVQHLPGNPFVVAYRLWRRVRARSDAELAYVSSIRRYMTLEDIRRMSGSFAAFEMAFFHILRPVSIALGRRRDGQWWRGLDSCLSRADQAILRRLPASSRISWIAAVVLKGCQSAA